MKKRPMLMLMDWVQQTIVSMYFCMKNSEKESFSILRKIIDLSMEELRLKFNLEDSCSSGLVLVIDLGSQNHSHTWFVMVFVVSYVFIVAYMGILTQENPKMKPKVRFCGLTSCLLNERKFHMHCSQLNIYLGIIEHITPKKSNLHSKRCLRSINARNAG